MLGSVTVPVGDTLTINPGIVIKPLSNTQLIINGVLIADGTPSEKIVFTSIKDDNFGNPMDTNKDGTISVPDKHDWRGIYFESNSDGLIDHGIVKYADYYYYNVHFYQYLGAIHINNANPTISNTEIKDVDYGIACLNTATPTLSNNQITNTTYTPVALSASADPTFSGNVFTNNGLTALGIVGERITSNGTIRNRDVAGFNSITYVLLSDLYIHTGSYIAVDSGVVIKIQPNAGIIVAGGFRVNGDAANKTYFTSVKDDNLGNPFDTNGDGNATAPAANDWENIMYIGSADDGYNVIDNAVLSYAGYGSYSWQLIQPCCTSYNSEGAISFQNAGGLVQNTIIDNSYYYGIETDGNSDPTFTNVTIQNCRLDPIAISLLSDPTFNNITFTANGSKGIRILEGTLSSNAQLKQRSVAGIPNIAYIIGSNNLTISSNAILTVDAGVVIKFDYIWSQIIINGGLKLLGTSSDKIILTSIKDDSAGGDTNNDGNSSVPAPSDWYSVVYNSTSNDTANIVQYAELRYAGRDNNSVYQNAALTINSAYALIDNTVIQQSGEWGIRITGNANPDISNCSFLNINDGPIVMSMFSNPTFTNNTALNVNYMALGIVSETWSQSATVPKRNFAGYTNISYFLTEDITINTGTSITIPDGVSFKRASDDIFIINGRLNVTGTGGSPVSFTDFRDDSYGVPLDMNQDGSATSPNYLNYNWLIFNDVSNDSSDINHAIFAYASDVIDCNSASPTVRNSTFENSNYGLRLDGVSNPILTDNTFNDLTYTPFQTSLVSYPAVTIGNNITGSTYRCIGVINETLVQDVTLSKKDFGGVTNIPYLFGTYTIGSGATLTFEPGVVNKFFNSGRIEVHKGLIAEGGATADSNIVFTHIEDDFYGGDNNADGDATTPSTNDWNGIWYQNDALDPLSRLDHCVFRFAGNNTTYGAITANSASPSIKNTLFNKCETALVATGAANPTINFCDFNDLDNYGVYNRDKSFVINAENNWWGSNTGPTHSGNPGGTGEPVTDAVDYDPWSTIVENPLMGDVSLNGIIQAYDASLTLQHVVAPFLNPDQLIVADVSGAAGISAFDASLILQFVVGLIDVFPAETVRLNDAYPVSDVALTIGSTNALVGDEITLPIAISNVSGVLGMDMLFNFDPELLTLTDVQIQNTTMNNMVDFSEAGQIKIAMAGTESLEADEVLGWLTFKVADEVNQSNIPIRIQSFLANEQELRRFSTNGDVTVEGIITDVTSNQTALLPVYPNPAKDIVNITYQVKNSGEQVKLSVFDVMGHEIAVLVNEIQNTGTHEIKWHITDAQYQLQSGYYFIRLSVGEINETRKVLLLN
ncbi:MAG: right-handed parallel beta-helix repeat-containing protein [Chitinophagales bacterium]